MKNKLILAGMTAALLAAPLGARAADLPHPLYKAPAYVGPAAANWTGFYVGINGGYGFGTSDWDIPAVSPDPSGYLAGATVGYNFQTGLWVWGFEADIDWADIKGDTSCLGGSCETKMDWFGTARVRIGYAGWNNWLPYLTGGAAFGDVKADLTTSGSDRLLDADRLDRRRRPRIRLPLELERQDRIPLRRSRLLRLRRGLRHDLQQRYLHHQYRARRPQLPLLIWRGPRAANNGKPRASARGFCLCGRSPKRPAGQTESHAEQTESHFKISIEFP